MAVWKQGILIVALVAAAFVLAAVFVPAARPMLDRIGLLAPLGRIGLVATASGAEAPAARPGASTTAGAAGGKPGAATVIAREAAPQVLRDVVEAIGSARAVRAVSLVPDVAGRIVRLDVASGDAVRAGDPVAELDSEAARIAVDRATLVVADAQDTRDRQARLQASGSTSELLLQEAELALRTAQLELRQAEFELSQHSITAPIGGWVGILQVEVGNQVTTTTEITRIEDRSSLLVEFRVPERVVNRIRPGDPLRAAALTDPGAELPGRITAIDNRVDEASRTLLVQAAIDNADDRLRPGMAIRISLDFTGDSHPAVDPLAIQWSAEGAYVWIVRDGKAQRLPIRILQRNSTDVLVDAVLQKGDLVVSEGVLSLRPGADVTVSATAPDAAAAAPKT